MVRTGVGELGTVELRGTAHEQRLHQHARVVHAFRQRHPVISEVDADPDIAPYQAPLPRPQQDPEQESRWSDPFAQFPGARQDRPRFRCGVTAHGDIRGGERAENAQLQIIALLGFLERLEQRQRGRQLADRLVVCRPLPRSQARLQPVAPRLRG